MLDPQKIPLADILGGNDTPDIDESADFGEHAATIDDLRASMASSGDAPAPAEKPKESTPPAKEETKPAVTPPAEPKPDDAPVDPLDLPNLEDIIPPEPKEDREKKVSTPSSRDLSMFDPQYHPYLRQMSNDAFDWVVTREKDMRARQQELEQLQETSERYKTSVMPTSADSYRMHPTYQGLVQDVGLINQQSTFWEQQLAKVREGEPAAGLVTNKDGELEIVEGQYPASTRTEAHILNQLSQLAVQKNQVVQNAQQFQTAFTESVTQHQQMVKNIGERLFAKYKPDQKAVDYVKSQFSPVMRNAPEVDLIAKGYSVIQQLVTMLKKVADIRAGEKALTAKETAQGPSAEASSVAGASPLQSNEEIINSMRAFIHSQ